MSMHFLVRFEATPAKEPDFREALRQVLEPTRAEPGCIAILAFETLRPPIVFAIHSEWVDEAAFELHTQLPHTIRFLAAAEALLTQPVEGLRVREVNSAE